MRDPGQNFPHPKEVLPRRDPGQVSRKVIVLNQATLQHLGRHGKPHCGRTPGSDMRPAA